MSLVINGVEITTLVIDGVRIEKAYINNALAFNAFDPETDDPTNIGEEWEGWLYAGKIRYPDGIYGIVISNKDHEMFTTMHDPISDMPMLDNFQDGKTNTDNMIENQVDLGVLISQTIIEGHNDWYIPAFYEMMHIQNMLCPGECLGYAMIPSVSQSYRLDRSIPPVDVSTDSIEVSIYPGFLNGESKAFDQTNYWTSTQSMTNKKEVYTFFSYGGSARGYDRERRAKLRLIRRVKLS